jgi:hypothetical protein
MLDVYKMITRKEIALVFEHGNITLVLLPFDTRSIPGVVVP